MTSRLGLVPPLLLEAPKRATKLYVLLPSPSLLAANPNFATTFTYCPTTNHSSPRPLPLHLTSPSPSPPEPPHSAANEFWGKTYRNLFNESKMTQSLSILTGCSAGATESFVVVPFELVKIKCVFLLLSCMCLFAYGQWFGFACCVVLRGVWCVGRSVGRR